jgi:hypothetical protein
MEYTFFNISAAFMPLLLLVASCIRKIKPAAVITGAMSVGYSMLFDISFGDRLGLYYYISPSKSTLYMVLSAVLIYLAANIVFLAFLPENPGRLVFYTSMWVAGMLLLEYACLVTRTIVFTGWDMFPWSIAAYVVTYVWLILFYRYLDRRLSTVRPG